MLVPAGEVCDLDDLRSRLVSAIEAARMATCPQITPTGSAAYVGSRQGDSPEILIERADSALHDIKERLRRGPDWIGDDPRVQNQPVMATSANEWSNPPGVGNVGSLTQVSTPRGLNRRLKRSSPLWRLLALPVGAMAIAVLAISAVNNEFSRTAFGGFMIGAGLAFLCVFCVSAALLGLRHRWMHAVCSAAILLLSFAVYNAGPIGAGMIDLFALIALLGFLMFSPPIAALYLVVSLGLFATFAITGDFMGAVERSVITAFVFVIFAAVMAKVRMATMGFVEKHRELSERDSLTGLANFRALSRRIGEAVDNSARLGSPTPVLIAIDLDDFKSVNDRFSHSTGDRLLTAVAHAIDEAVDGDALIARRGGDEFYVLTEIDRSDQVTCDNTITRIKQLIADAGLRVCPEVSPTASVAAVAYTQGTDPTEFLHEADLVLHVAKEHSRMSRIDQSRSMVVSDESSGEIRWGDLEYKQRLA